MVRFTGSFFFFFFFTNTVLYFFPPYFFSLGEGTSGASTSGQDRSPAHVEARVIVKRGPLGTRRSPRSPNPIHVVGDAAALAGKSGSVFPPRTT